MGLWGDGPPWRDPDRILLIGLWFLAMWGVVFETELTGLGQGAME
ncbi:MAG: hypothetical protein H6Q48_1211 [Deltaproteobacteria bacterium]|jgi:hypothetical protein|nr:hypothetical protein [Deltaproteobacteria bacterium]